MAGQILRNIFNVHDQETGELVGYVNPVTGRAEPFEGAVSVRYFGAKGDGGADDTAAFIAAKDSGSGSAFVPKGPYRLTQDVIGRYWGLGGAYFYVDSGVASVADVRNVLPAVGRTDEVELIAHRGFKALMPENTMPAMSFAIANGANAIECDIQVSSDGVLYLMHNLTVDSMTNGTGTLTSLTSAYVDSLSIDVALAANFPGTKVARFADVLKLASAAGVRVYAEIKAVRSEADYGLIVDAIAAAGMSDRVVLQSALSVNLQTIREQYSTTVGLGFLGAGYVSNYRFEIERIADFQGCLIWDKADILARPDVAAYCAKRGVPLVAYTIASQADMPALQALGVRRFMSEFPVSI